MKKINFWDKDNKVFIFETNEWTIWATKELPTFNTKYITTRNLTLSQIEAITSWDMSLPKQIISNLKEKWKEKR